MKRLLLSGLMVLGLLNASPVYVCHESVGVQRDGKMKRFDPVYVPATITGNSFIIYITDETQYYLPYVSSGKTKDGVSFKMYGRDNSVYAAVYDNFKKGIRLIFSNGGEVWLGKCKKEKK